MPDAPTNPSISPSAGGSRDDHHSTSLPFSIPPTIEQAPALLAGMSDDGKRSLAAYQNLSKFAVLSQDLPLLSEIFHGTWQIISREATMANERYTEASHAGTNETDTNVPPIEPVPCQNTQDRQEERTREASLAERSPTDPTQR